MYLDMERTFIRKHADDLMQIRAMSIKTADDPDKRAKEVDQMIAEEMESAKAKYDKMSEKDIVRELLDSIGITVVDKSGKENE